MCGGQGVQCSVVYWCYRLHSRANAASGWSMSSTNTVEPQNVFKQWWHSVLARLKGALWLAYSLETVGIEYFFKEKGPPLLSHE